MATNFEHAYPQIDAEDDEGVEDLDDASTTMSLRSSLLHNEYKHGRQYQTRPGEDYHRPNDEDELNRLDLMCEMFTLLNEGKLTRAPISDELQRILDIGIGTGAWAIAAGDEFPSAEVIGVDVGAAALPTVVPPNVRFEVADLEDEWTFNQPFDFIYCRYMAGAIKDWPQLVRRTYENLKPGSWAEFADLDILYYSQDGTMNETHKTVEWIEICNNACEKMGRTLRPGKKLEGWIKDAGFSNVQVRRDPVPVNRWPKDKRLKRIGLLNYVQLHEGLTGLCVRLFVDYLGWSREDMELLLMQVRKEFSDPAIHCMYDMYTVCGQKPKV